MGDRETGKHCECHEGTQSNISLALFVSLSLSTYPTISVSNKLLLVSNMHHQLAGDHHPIQIATVRQIVFRWNLTAESRLQLMTYQLVKVAYLDVTDCFSSRPGILKPTAVSHPILS